MDKPYSPACDRNKDPILKELSSLLESPCTVLELGSGTGQHAVHFGANLPHIQWLTSDLQQNHDGIRMWLEEAALPNVTPPISLDVSWETWPDLESVQLVFSANMIHIMPWEQVPGLFSGAGRLLKTGGLLCLYGPFNYGGQFTSPSNASFNQWLLDRHPSYGIRNFEDLIVMAKENGLDLRTDTPMPANNRFLVWQRL